MKAAMRARRAAETARILPPTRANAGLEARYRRRLQDEITKMYKSVDYWLTAEYRATGLAQDASPADQMQRQLTRLRGRWEKAFDQMGRWLSSSFARAARQHARGALSAYLRARDISVSFQATPDETDALAAVINENVSLIKSIPSRFLDNVESLVMQSVARGRDLGALKKQIEAQYGVTSRRAALIARDQNNKATSAMASASQQSLGISQGIWRHSHAGKEPRPSHVAADGVRFDLSRGLYLDGEWVLPGEAINCRCTWEPVIPGLDE